MDSASNNVIEDLFQNKQTKNELCGCPHANYTNRLTSAHQRILVATFMDRGVSHGQHGGSPQPLVSVFETRAATFSFK
jgi:hypothetical protein